MLEANNNTMLKTEEIKNLLAALKPETRICLIQDLNLASSDIHDDLKDPTLEQGIVDKLLEEMRVIRIILGHANEVQAEWLQMKPQPPTKPAPEGF